MHSKFQWTLIVSSVIVLHTACKREFTDPNAQSAGTTTGAVTRTDRFNFMSGTPTNKTVTVGQFGHLLSAQQSASLNRPASVVSDGAGRIWVSDYGANQIKVINKISGQVVYTIGTGNAGYQDGGSPVASFNHPSGIALGPDGLLYVADMGNNRIRIVDAATYNVSTFAGSGVAGFADGPLTTAKFNGPTGIAIDANGTFYIADQGNNMIRRITGRTTVTRWCGQTTAGAVDGTGAYASFDHPTGVALSPAGSLYVTDLYNDKIRKITNGNVTTLAGSGQPGNKDGDGSAASFFWPEGIATDSTGNLYVTDYANASIRFITPAGTVSTLGGGLSKGSTDGWGLYASFTAPTGIDIDPRGAIYITDEWEPSVRTLSLIPAINTLAGGNISGDKDGTGYNALFTSLSSVAAAPDGSVYVVDSYPTDNSHIVVGTRIRKITPQGKTSFFAGNIQNGYVDGPAATAQFGQMCEVTVGPDGNVYVADQNNGVIRKIAGGYVTTLAGVTAPTQITTDPAGNIYTLSFATKKITRTTPNGVTTIIHDMTTLLNTEPYSTPIALAVNNQGHIFVISGHNIYEYAADNQEASLYFTANAIDMLAMTIDAANNLYLTGYGVVYKLTPGRSLYVLGGDVNRRNSVDGPLASAGIAEIVGLAVSPDGRTLYMEDWYNYRIRMVSTAQ